MSLRDDLVPASFRFPQCNKCRHHRGDLTCAAFPERIPDEISLNRHDHREPYPGDGGIRFEAKPGEEHPGLEHPWANFDQT